MSTFLLYYFATLDVVMGERGNGWRFSRLLLSSLEIQRKWGLLLWTSLPVIAEKTALEMVGLIQIDVTIEAAGGLGTCFGP